MPRISPSPSHTLWRAVPESSTPPRRRTRRPSALAPVPPRSDVVLRAPGQDTAPMVRQALARWLYQAWTAGCRLVVEALESQGAAGPMTWDGFQPMRAVVPPPSPRRPLPVGTSPLTQFGRYASLPRLELAHAAASALTCPICYEPAQKLRRPVAVVHSGGINVYEHHELMEDWRRSCLHWQSTPDKIPFKKLYRLVITPSESVGTQGAGGRHDVLGLWQDGAL